MGYSFDRPRHGWEGLSNGGEIYGRNVKKNSEEFLNLNNDSFNRQDYLERIDQSSDKMKILVDDLLEDKPYIDRLTFEQKKKIFFEKFNSFVWINKVLDEDINKIVDLYEKKSLTISKNPWAPSYRHNTLVMLDSVYEIIKNKNYYNDVIDRVSVSFEENLNKKLLKPVYYYGEETDERYRASYATEKEYSLTLADMCIRKLELLKYDFEKSKDISLVSHALSVYEDIRKNFISDDITLPENSEKTYLEIKSLVVLLQKEKADLIEKERQQRELELLKIKQSIEQKEKEIIDIKKKLFQLTSGKLFSSFENRFARKYPEEYNDFKSYYNKVSKYKSTYSYENDLRNKFSSISTELEFYKEALKVYENFNMRYNQMVVEVVEERKLDKGIGAIKEVLNKINSKVGTPISARISRKYPEEYKNFIDYCDKLHDYKYLGSFKDKWEEYEFYENALQVYGKFDMRYNQMVAEIEDERTKENEKKKILDLIYSDEKLRYKLISSYPVGVRIIPEEFKGMSYEQVKEVLNHRKEQEKNEQLILKEELIIKAIKRFYGKNDSYQLSEEEISNIRYKFEDWNIDMLKNYIDRFDAILMKYKVVDGEIVYNDDIFEKKDDVISNELNKDDKRNVLISKTLEKMFPNGASEEDLMSKEFSGEFIKTMNSVCLDDLNQTSSRHR